MTQARLNLRPAVLLCALLLTALLALPAAADTLLTIESRQALSVNGQQQPERSQTVQVWIGDDAVARDDAETRTVLAGDELLLISHRNRNYSRIELPVDPLDLAPPEMREQMAARFAESKLSGELTASEESEEVGDWTAKRYDLVLTSEAGLAVDMVVWATAEVEADAERFNALTRALASMQLGGADWVSKLNEIDGFPVRRETTMVNDALEMHSTETLVSVTEAEAPGGMFGVPVGYTEVELPAAAEESEGEGEGEAEEEMEEEEDGEEMEEDGEEMEEDGEEMEEDGEEMEDEVDG